MVLQRWQTVYLLIAVILMIVTNFVPVMTIGDATGVVDVTFANVLGAESSQIGMTAYFVLADVCALLSLLTIFKFKNLKLQMQLCSVLELLYLAAVAVAVVDVMMLPADAVVEVALGAFAVPFAMICTFLARAGVKKDRDLLKSVEHFR